MNLCHTLPYNNILIIGGTGTFGQACTKHLLEHRPDIKIRIFSRDEAKQLAMQQSLNSHAHGNSVTFMIGDVRDSYRLERAMRGVDLVLHAAALKQVPAGETNCDEFIKTNIMGSMNVGEAAIRSGVKRVVFLSTDKASMPQTAYGATKLVAERYFIGANNYSADTDFVVTRYGNVAGSRGSVIPFFRELIKENKKLPLTDPESTRFWMYISQAVNLVLLAAMLGNRGEVFIPRLPSFQLITLASAMLNKPQYNIFFDDICIVGLRGSEKKHESLANDDELRRCRLVVNPYGCGFDIFSITDTILNCGDVPEEYNSNSFHCVKQLSASDLQAMLLRVE